MQIVKAVILGIVQGITEFLPVSSSGHLVLAKHLLQLQEQGIEFEVFLHFGTLLAVLTVFRKDIMNLIAGFFSLFTPQFYHDGMQSRFRSDAYFRLLVFIVLASVPAGVVGLLFEDQIEAFFSQPRLTSINLIITAVILTLTLLARKNSRELSLKNTFIMGIAQAVAILPGISRSGSTISAGLYQGVKSEEAARFSFLLAVPAILGATLLHALKMIEAGFSGEQFMALAIGMAAAYLAGLLAIESMLALVRRGKLFYFAPYCLILGILGLLLIH
ncbi:MAG: undecaprenyl-diphosphate phosphatase [Calditrichaeota bacterium]|nr:MAG: undecaprenyl-diphosphate phosphatase [Calditrichota bacterium]